MEDLPLALVRRLVKRMEEECTPSDPELDMAGYRCEAIFSLVSFAGMKALEKLAPEAFAGMKVFRSLLVLAIARNFLKNGVVGMVKERRPNADTLTSTAVIASVLAGKPESSLTLLTLGAAGRHRPSARPARVGRLLAARLPVLLQRADGSTPAATIRSSPSRTTGTWPSRRPAPRTTPASPRSSPSTRATTGKIGRASCRERV